ncbi:MAG: cytochrome c biogenesis CcdA family protein [Hyphomicrobiaceae bacterium]|nr:cytochrome c biogenesis protein CcdA [Hyphomicrobiaceae bacterium]
MLGTLVFAFMAGFVSLLSPCTLPLIPIILAAAIGEHRQGPLALAAGLSLSFTLLGLIVALAGHSLGLSEDRVRNVAAIILILAGIVLLSPALQTRLATLLEPIANKVAGLSQSSPKSGLVGQFSVGVLLGAIWSPCVGPTMGAASLMAARGENIGQVAATMLAFGLGAGLPLAAIGFLPPATLLRVRSKLASVGRGGRLVMGALLVVVGFSVLSGFDKRIEAAIVRLMPSWLLELTTGL